ncbi:hypothetical protein CYMTET_8087 [Cymbomonas tetramitiformis]|uniref:CUB domain-containing protein n=1 Tax=Cymbomonas tetramitiformis TaxID=36881 RepID=A0AAE0GVL6_9CHLO|nr:hypothetical protein CYMTET_8087 [Cymbomonas tetramitiformis]
MPNNRLNVFVGLTTLWLCAVGSKIDATGGAWTESSATPYDAPRFSILAARFIHELSALIPTFSDVDTNGDASLNGPEFSRAMDSLQTNLWRIANRHEILLNRSAAPPQGTKTGEPAQGLGRVADRALMQEGDSNTSGVPPMAVLHYEFGTRSLAADTSLSSAGSSSPDLIDVGDFYDGAFPYCGPAQEFEFDDVLQQHVLRIVYNKGIYIPDIGAVLRTGDATEYSVRLTVKFDKPANSSEGSWQHLSRILNVNSASPDRGLYLHQGSPWISLDNPPTWPLVPAGEWINLTVTTSPARVTTVYIDGGEELSGHTLLWDNASDWEQGMRIADDHMLFFNDDGVEYCEVNSTLDNVVHVKSIAVYDTELDAEQVASLEDVAPSPPAPPPPPMHFIVSTGGCVAVGSCLTSPNYPEDYPPNHECVARVSQAATLVVGASFNMEMLYDYFYVDDAEFSGELPAGEVLGTVGGATSIQFKSDRAYEFSGFEVCLTDLSPPPPFYPPFNSGVGFELAGTGCNLADDGMCFQTTLDSEGLYSNNVNCEVAAAQHGYLHVVEFHTESDYDFFNLDASKYSGELVANGVTLTGTLLQGLEIFPDTAMSFTSDGSDLCVGFSYDGFCDDGGLGSATSWCECGADCWDCGTRSVETCGPGCFTDGQYGTARALSACKFPFTIYGVNYTTCTHDFFENTAEYGWCITTDGQWGSCEASCFEHPPPQPLPPTSPPSDAMRVLNNGSLAVIEDRAASFGELSEALLNATVTTILLYTNVSLADALPAINRSLEIWGECGGEPPDGDQLLNTTTCTSASHAAGSLPTLCELDGRSEHRHFLTREGRWTLVLRRLVLRDGLVKNEDGGALYLARGWEVLLQDCRLLGNSARSGRCENTCDHTHDMCDDGGPGASYTLGGSGHCALGTDCRDCGTRFPGGRGGAVYMETNTSLTLQNSSVEGAYARNFGGAIYADVESLVHVEDSLIQRIGTGKSDCVNNASYRWRDATDSTEHDCDGTLQRLTSHAQNWTRHMAHKCDMVVQELEHVGLAHLFSTEEEERFMQLCPLTCGICINGGCTDTCLFANNEICEDGGDGTTSDSFSVGNRCELGTDCTDCGERGSDGGGLYVAKRAQLHLMHSTVSHATVDRRGGGIHAEEQTVVTLTGSVITQNTARSGGGVFAQAGAAITLRAASSLSHNSAVIGGAGILLGDNASGSEIAAMEVLEASMVDNNTCERGSGGGMWLGKHSSAAFGGGSSLSWNEAAADGGGVYADEGASLAISGSQVDGNVAELGAGVRGVGMKFLLVSEGSFFRRNQARGSGGCVHLTDAHARTQMGLDASEFSNNSAGQNGGCIFLDDMSVATATVQNQMLITGNTAGEALP